MGASGLQYRQIIGRFFNRLEAVTSGAWENDLAFKVTTDQSQEEYKWLGMTPAVREWVGGRLAKGFRENGITIRNKTFEATLDVNVDELRRDKTSQLNVRIDELAGRVSEHWSKLLTELIVTPGNSYDGTTFFSASHTEGDSGTQLNLLTSTQVTALNVGTANAPTVDEMQKAILGVVGYMLQYKDDQGEPMNANGRGWTIMVPPNMWAAATGALTLPNISNGTNLITNPLPLMRGFQFNVVTNPRLSADTIFYTFRTDAPVKPFIMQEELFETGMDESEVFKNNRILFGVKAIRNVGTAYWQCASKSTLS